MTDAAAQGATLQGYLRVLRRRIWVILLTVVLVGLAVTFFTLRQAPLYEATAEVLLSRQNLAATLTDTQDPLASQEAGRAAQTQADLARVPRVARRVIRATGIDRTPEQLVAASSVHPKRDSDLLIFEVSDGDADVASRLVTAYAREFTRYRRELDTIAYRRARRGVESRIARLEAEGSRRTPLYAALVETEQQLRTLETLQISNTEVVRAGEATQVRPTPKRNAILGLALGLVVGIGLGFLREALDARIRSGEEIAERVGLPLLARIPEPPRRLRARDELVMIADPTGSEAEAFRMLRTNIEFANLDRGARTIMMTSALEGEGKSTTVANLAVAYGRAGKRVALVDLDMRRPFLDRFFQLEGIPGLTDVALGQAKLEDAIAHVSVSGDERATQERAEGNGTATVEGVVDVLTSGPLPPDAGEFVGTQAITEILQQLRERYELVLVDAPPLLHIGDAMTLAAKVDGLLLVSSLRRARRPVLTELRRILQTLPTIKLGVVVAAAQLEEDDRYRDADYYRRSLPRPPAREPVRKGS